MQPQERSSLEQQAITYGRQLVEQIRSCTVNGFVVSRFDTQKQDPISTNVSADDIADYLFFVSWFADITEDEDLSKWSMDQYRMIEQRSHDRWGMHTDFDAQNETRKPVRLIGVHYQEDRCVGLTNYRYLTGSEEYVEELKTFLDSVVSKATYRNGMVASALTHPFAIKTHRSYAEASGLYAESLCDLYEMSRDKNCLFQARKLLLAWKGIADTSLLPQGINVFTKKPLDLPTKVMKSNTNFLFGLISLYSHSEDEEVLAFAQQLISRIQDLGENPGAIPLYIQDTEEGSISKTASHAFLDVCLQYFLATNDVQMRQYCIETGKYWASCANKKNLIAENPESERVLSAPEGKKGAVVLNDSHADMMVMFLKLHALTQDEVFLKAAADQLEAYPLFLDGFPMFVGMNGEPITFENKTKFLGGLLKGICAFIVSMRGADILRERPYTLFVRDR